MSSSDPNRPKSSHGGYPNANSTSGQNYGFSPQAAGAAPSPIPTTGYTYNIGAVSPTFASGTAIKFSSAQLIQRLVWEFLDDGKVTATFQQEEGNHITQALLEPDSGMTALDSLRLQVLFSACDSAITHGVSANMQPISYIRRHNLERHFRFSSK
jgi:hypothetical protein